MPFATNHNLVKTSKQLSKVSGETIELSSLGPPRYVLFSYEPALVFSLEMAEVTVSLSLELLGSMHKPF